MAPDVIVQAMRAHSSLDIVHRKDGCEAIGRTVLPYWLVRARSGHLYVHCYCGLRRARRSFRLDRIESATLRGDAVYQQTYERCAVGGLDTPPMGIVLAHI